MRRLSWNCAFLWVFVCIAGCEQGSRTADNPATDNPAQAKSAQSKPGPTQPSSQPTRTADKADEPVRAVSRDDDAPDKSRQGTNSGAGQQDASDKQAVAEKPVEAQAPPRVAANAAEVVAKLDARKFPRLSATGVLDDSATYLYYAAKASPAAADAFYSGELESGGWKPVPSTTPENPQYVDRLYQKDGYFVRLTVYESGDEGIVGISLSNLGNIDLTTLPRLANAELNPASTPVNVNYNTTEGIASATKACRELFREGGWHEYRDFTDPPEAPHVKQLAFRKNAVRVNLLVIRDPNIPNMDKTMVTYMAHHAMPCDVPVIEGGKGLQIDARFERAEYTTDAPVAALVEFYRTAAQQTGWRLRKDAESIRDEAASLYVEDEPELGFGIQIVRGEDSTKVRFQRLSFAESRPESPPLTAGDLAATEPSADPSPVEEGTDDAQDLARDIKQQIKRELGKAGADLDKLGVNLDGLLGAEDDEDDAAEDQAPGESATASDKEPETVDSSQLAKLETHCKIHYGDATYELSHVVAIRKQDDDQVTPVLMWSDKPLSTDKARSLLARGKDVSLFDIEGQGSPVSLELRLQASYAFVACFVDGASLNLGSSDIQTDFRVLGNRLRGTASLPEPTELGGRPFRFEASFDLEFLVPGKAPAEGSLMADADHELPVPEGCSGVSTEKSPFRQVLEARLEEPLGDVLKFYRSEAARLQWKEDAAKANVTATLARLAFVAAQGPVTLALKAEQDVTQITLTVRDEKLAKEQGILPAAGKVKLLLGNASQAEIVITVDNRNHKLAAGQGAQDPADAIKLDLTPGKHKVTAKIDGVTKAEELDLEAGSAWGVIAAPDLGLFSNQVY